MVILMSFCFLTYFMIHLSFLFHDSLLLFINIVFVQNIPNLEHSSFHNMFFIFFHLFHDSPITPIVIIVPTIQFCHGFVFADLTYSPLIFSLLSRFIYHPYHCHCPKHYVVIQFLSLLWLFYMNH